MAEYDAIVDKYAAIKTCPCKMYCEEYTTWFLLGDVKGLSILDIACGDGFYDRPLYKKGARVIGVDISEEQIARARLLNTTEFDIVYHAADAFNIPALQLGKVDVVLSHFMFGYCKSKEELQRICSIAASSLKQGGRFIFITGVMRNDTVLNSQHLGFDIMRSDILSDDVTQTCFRLHSLDRQSHVDLTQYVWSKQAINEALSSAGFQFYWPDFQIHPDGRDWFSSPEAQDHLKRSPVVFCVATKL